jgi:putative oxidoreductase
MKGFTHRYEQQAHAALRITAGFWLACHGLQKFGFLGGNIESFGSAMNAAGLFEVPGGILLVLGLFTPHVAFIMSGQMAVAYYMYFQMFAPPGTVLPLNQGGEIAALLSFICLYVSAHGSDSFSLDRALFGSRDRHRVAVRSAQAP